MTPTADTTPENVARMVAGLRRVSMDIGIPSNSVIDSAKVRELAAMLEALAAQRDAAQVLLAGAEEMRISNLTRIDAERTRLCALLRRAHDAMSRREPDGVSDAEWDALVSEIAKEAGHG